jgi:hypothetical protein
MQAGAQSLFNESAAFVELFVDSRHRNFLTAYLGADDIKDLPQVRLCPRPSTSRRTGAKGCHRLAPQRCGTAWPGRPVQGVFELARDRAVVLGRDTTPRLRP